MAPVGKEIEWPGLILDEISKEWDSPHINSSFEHYLLLRICRFSTDCKVHSTSVMSFIQWWALYSVVEALWKHFRSFGDWDRKIKHALIPAENYRSSSFNPWKYGIQEQRVCPCTMFWQFTRKHTVNPYGNGRENEWFSLLLSLPEN
jgi:hypothetical protein